MLLVELSEAEIWLNRVSRGEVEEVDVEEELGSEVVWALRSCWTFAMAVLESATLPEARSLRRAARSLVSVAVAVVVGSAAVVEAVLEVLVVEAVAEVLVVWPVRSSCSIKARAEDERAEMDMRGPFRAVELLLQGMSAGARKTLADSLRRPNRGHYLTARREGRRMMGVLSCLGLHLWSC